MKGIMVPLLVLMMTGMVIGRQTHAQDNSADSAFPKNGRFLLDMTDQWIDSLKKEGILQAPIKPEFRQHINEIDIRYKTDAPVADLIPFSINQVSSGNDGTLYFVLTDSDLEIMKRRGLRYTLPDEDRGKYDSVLVRYQSFDPTDASNSAGQSTSSGFDPNPARPIGNGLPANANSNFRETVTDTDRLLRGTSPSAATLDMGRRRRDSNLASDNQFSTSENARRLGNQLPTPMQPAGFPDAGRLPTRGGDRSYEPTTASSLQELRSNTDNWTNPPFSSQQNPQQLLPTNGNRTRSYDSGLGAVADRSQVNAGPDNLQTLQDRMMREEAERLQRQSMEVENLRAERLARERIEIQNQLNRERYLKSLRDSQQTEDIAGDRLAMRSNNSYAYPYSDETRPLIDNPSNRFPNRRFDEYGNQLVNTSSGAPSMPPERVTIGPKPSGPLPAAIGGPDGNSLERVAQNSATSAQAGNRNDVGNLAGRSAGTLADMNTQMSRMRQTTGMLWFMMLCSLGLNVYLGWIARGFYVRYEELADELRETFTSTM